MLGNSTNGDDEEEDYCINNKGCKKEQVMQCLGFLQLICRPIRTEIQLYRDRRQDVVQEMEGK